MGKRNKNRKAEKVAGKRAYGATDTHVVASQGTNKRIHPDGEPRSSPTAAECVTEERATAADHVEAAVPGDPIIIDDGGTGTAAAEHPTGIARPPDAAIRADHACTVPMHDSHASTFRDAGAGDAGMCTEDPGVDETAPELPGPDAPSPPAPTPDIRNSFSFQQVWLSESAVICRACQVTGLRAAPLTWRDVLQMWVGGDACFGDEFRGTLRSCEFEDFFWECSPVSATTVDAPFEFVLIDARGVLQNRATSCTDFQEHLTCARGQLATEFFNLGGDALLVVPTRHSTTRKHSYGHLASFTREAPEEQQVELWQYAGHAVQNALDDDPSIVIWVNTDGNGVPWLHVRLDMYPKYIKHHPYRSQHDARERALPSTKHMHDEHRTRAKRSKRGKKGRDSKRRSAPAPPSTSVRPGTSTWNGDSEHIGNRIQPTRTMHIATSGRLLQHALAATGGTSGSVGTLNSMLLLCFKLCSFRQPRRGMSLQLVPRVWCSIR